MWTLFQAIQWFVEAVDEILLALNLTFRGLFHENMFFQETMQECYADVYMVNIPMFCGYSKAMAY